VACSCASCSLCCSIVAVASGFFVCRPGDYKPLPPPKTGAPYKPVPPPKPKNYRPPLAPEGGGGTWGYGGGPPSQPCGDADSTVAAMLKQTKGMPSYQHAKSYSVAGGLDAAGYMPQHNGGKQQSCMQYTVYKLEHLSTIIPPSPVCSYIV
jgi:hypothetical protein